MKKLLLLIIIGVLITVSCSNDSDTDLYTEIAKNEEAMRGAVNNKARGTYELVWLMDKHAVDNAVFSSELDPYYYVITHQDNLSKILFILVGAEFFLFAFAYPLQFPILARYNNST